MSMQAFYRYQEVISTFERRWRRFMAVPEPDAVPGRTAPAGAPDVVAARRAAEDALVELIALRPLLAPPSRVAMARLLPKLKALADNAPEPRFLTRSAYTRYVAEGEEVVRALRAHFDPADDAPSRTA